MYIDNGGTSDSGGEVTWASIGESMIQFASMAANGGFEVNKTGGDALLRAIRKMKDWVNHEELALLRLAREMPLGTSHAAQVMKPYVQQVATDDQGFLTKLKEFRDSLDAAERGIQTAMANYQTTEAETMSTLHQAGPQ